MSQLDLEGKPKEKCTLHHRNWKAGYSLSCVPSYEKTRESCVCYDKPKNIFLEPTLKMWLIANCEKCAYDSKFLLERSKIRELLITEIKK